MISCQQLGFCIGAATLLDGITLALEPGTVTAVVGPNGAGKSTLLSLLAASRQPSSGQLWWGTQLLSAMPIEQLARQRAVMTQGDDLVFPFLVEEVVLMGRHPHNRGWADARDREIAGRALHVAGAIHLQGRIYSQCSGGERQRIQLARALAQIWHRVEHGDGARVLLLDEPTSALDLAHQHACLQVVRQFAQQGVAVLTVLHHLDLAATYADTMLVLDQGRAAALGPVSEVMDPAILSPVYHIPLNCGQDAEGRWWVHTCPEQQEDAEKNRIISEELSHV